MVFSNDETCPASSLAHWERVKSSWECRSSFLFFDCEQRASSGKRLACTGVRLFVAFVLCCVIFTLWRAAFRSCREHDERWWYPSAVLLKPIQLEGRRATFAQWISSVVVFCFVFSEKSAQFAVGRCPSKWRNSCWRDARNSRYLSWKMLAKSLSYCLTRRRCVFNWMSVLTSRVTR